MELRMLEILSRGICFFHLHGRPEGPNPSQQGRQRVPPAAPHIRRKSGRNLDYQRRSKATLERLTAIHKAAARLLRLHRGQGGARPRTQAWPPRKHAKQGRVVTIHGLAHITQATHGSRMYLLKKLKIMMMIAIYYQSYTTPYRIMGVLTDEGGLPKKKIRRQEIPK